MPAVVISPWIARHRVDHTEREHSCIGETLRQRFAAGGGAMPLNDRDVQHLGNLFDLDSPRRGADLPGVVPLSYDAARALEEVHGAKKDPTDDNPALDVAHQGAIQSLIDAVREHLPI